MKKLIIVFLAVFFAFGMAQAGEQVSIQAPDNPGIPAGSCQGISSIVLGLSGNVTLREGDTGQFNLPVGITVCKDVDFFVGNATARIALGTVVGTYGPLVLLKAPVAGTAAGVYIRVQAPVGSQSVVLTVIGDGVGTNDFVQMGGGDLELAMEIRLFGRSIWAGFIPSAKFEFSLGPNQGISSWLYTDGNGDGLITSPRGPGDAPMQTPRDNSSDKNDANAVCIQTPANWTALVTAAFESQDILNPGIPKWDFTNDPGFAAGDNVIFVANILSATAFECLPICKQDDWDYVPIDTVGQSGGGACAFNYNAVPVAAWGAGAGYCATSGWPGQILAIKKTTNFTGGDYQLVATVTGNGTYFNSSTGILVQGMALGTANDTVCTGTGATTVSTGTISWFSTVGPHTVAAGAPACSVPASETVTRVVVGLGAINPYAILRVVLPVFQYNLTSVASGDEVDVTLDLIKLPCGTIFTCTEKVAEYIDSCAVAPGPCDAFTLPYFPPINDAVWWSGAALSNCSSGGATCDLMFYESDGDWGTYTQTLGAWGQWSGLWTSISASIVPDAGNAGTLGDATFFVCICCSPGVGARAGSPVSALGMMGTGDQSHGYDVNSW